MECLYCNSELEYHDYFGRLCAHQDGKVLGEIYVCLNGREDNCDSSNFNGFFHVYSDDSVLREGYPC